MGKKRKVPEVLWRLFRNRTRSLAHTIISLITQSPPSKCRCKCNDSRCCLLCKCNGIENAISFLVQPDDPSDYSNLLYQCFIVINDNAPPLSDYSLDNRWPQFEVGLYFTLNPCERSDFASTICFKPLSCLRLQIVKRTIEMIMAEQPLSSNIICSGHDTGKSSSLIVELLTDSSWCLLLKRVGDDVMIYLLKYSSIFLPLPHKKHHQVAGPAINDLRLKSSKLTAKSHCQHPPFVQFVSQKKRKRVDHVSLILERQSANSSVSYCNNLSSIGCAGSNGRRFLKPFSEHRGHNNGQLSFSGVATLTEVVVASKNKENSNEKLQQISNQLTAKSRKRLRPFSWQRRRNRSKINFEESCDKTSLAVCTDEDRLRERLQCVINNRMQEKCFCCLMLQAPKFVTERDCINRRSMFYSLEWSSTALPRKHILNSLKPSFADSKFLIKNIFGLSSAKASAQSMPCSHSSDFYSIGSACLFHSLIKLLKILIHRSQCCQHLKLLDKHCAVSSSDQKATENSISLFDGNELGEKVHEKCHNSSTKNCERTLEASESQFEAIKPYCLRSQVVSFIWAVCRSIIPADLLGTPSHWRVLRRNISKFIQLRRFEKFSMRQCMHKLKTSKFPFLSNKHPLCFSDAGVLKDTAGQNVLMHKEFSKLNNAVLNMKHKLLRNWIFWLFSCLVVPLVQANFYATESEHGKQDIYYYQKSVWKKLTNKTISCLKDKNYCHLDDAAVRSVISNRSFGFSKLRLLPKEDGVRMLANLKASSKILAGKSCFEETCSRMPKNAQFCHKRVMFDDFKSVNYVLRDAHAVLKGLLLKEPNNLGSSVFDYNDVYRKLCPFLISLRNRSPTVPGVFVVVSDVSKAFDSVDQDKLLRVMKDVILQDEYILQQFYQVICTKKSLCVRGNLLLMDENASTYYTRFTPSISFPSLHGVLVNQGWSRCVRKEELFFILNEHVKRNVLLLDKKFYLQGIGIPQGSVLSTLLCSLYYGDMERNVIYPFLEKTRESATEVLSGSHNSGQNTGDNSVSSSPSYMLLRFIDDFLFISTSKKQASNFYYRLQRGFRDYNCYMNEEKFCVNFDIGHNSGLPSNRVIVGEDGITFLRWSGLLINSSTLEVLGDYTRYLNNHLSATLTVCWQGKPIKHLKSRLHGFMRPKCHPIFFDSNINSAAVVRLNIYQAFLLCAMKFHCYISHLSYICNLSATSHLKVIEGSLRYMHSLIRKRMGSVSLGQPNMHPKLELAEDEVEWLGLNGYVQVLKRKQSRHKELLLLLRSKLLGQRITVAGSVSSPLKYALDQSHSSLIWKIKY